MIRFHRGHALAVPALLALPVVSVAPAGMSVVFALGAGVAALAALREDGPRGLLNRIRIGPWRAALVLIIAALATAPFALAPGPSFAFAPYLAGALFAAFLVAGSAEALAPDERAMAAWALHAGWAAGIVVLGVEVASDNGIALGIETWERSGVEIRRAHHNRGATTLALMLAPLVAMLWRDGKKGAAVVAVLLSLAVIAKAESATARLALATGSAGAFVAWTVGSRWPRVIALATGAVFFAMPLLGRLPVDLDRLVAEHPEVKISAFHRFYIWRFAVDRIAEHPLIGWGIDASRRIPGGSAKSPVDGQILGLHPHNAGIQLWLELGAAGGAIGAAFVGLVAFAICRVGDPMGRASAGFVFAAALTFAFLSFGVWQGWWIGLLALAAAWAIAAAYPARR